MINTIFFRKQLKAIGCLAVNHWPDDAIWTKSAGHTNDVQQIPARPTVFPAPLVRVVKITPQQMTDKLIIKANTIKAGCDRIWCKHLID
ncbi:hypothetical protein D3C72_1412110 [compost metagenome]